MKKRQSDSSNPLYGATMDNNDLDEVRKRVLDGHIETSERLLNGNYRNRDKARAVSLMLIRSWQLDIAPPRSLVELATDLLGHHYKGVANSPVRGGSSKHWMASVKFEGAYPSDPKSTNPSTAKLADIAREVFGEDQGDNHRRTIRNWRKLPQYTLDVEYWRMLGASNRNSTELFVNLHLNRLNVIVHRD